MITNKEGALKERITAVLFEGVLYEMDQNRAKEFSAIVSENAETTDLRHEKLNLKLHLSVNDNGMVVLKSVEA